MTHRVTLVPGDSTGPELCELVQRAVARLGVQVAWDLQPMATGEPTPELLASARENGAVLMAFQKGRREESKPAPVVQLRKALGVYANVRPVHTLPGLRARFERVDLVVVRELTEDVYAHLEHETIPGVFESLKVTTAEACERIATFAFDYAVKNGRSKVTIVHKSNIMKKSDGLFLRTARKVAERYPQITVDDCIVDALCMKLIIDPTKFDVLLCGNLFGDIVADVVAGLAGGPSNCPSMSHGADGFAMFSAPHGDPIEAVGTGRANPLGMLLPTVLLLRHLGEQEAANRLMTGITQTLAAGKLPWALGGSTDAAAFIEAVTA
jgi:isocitrate dehydrogenase (NAD+)